MYLQLALPDTHVYHPPDYRLTKQSSIPHHAVVTRPVAAHQAAAALRTAPSSIACPASYPALTSQRPLHTTRACLKKGKSNAEEKGKGKADKKQKGGKNNNSEASSSSLSSSGGKNSGGGGNESAGGESSSQQHPTPNPEEPLDFADVRSRLDKASGRTVETLKRMRSGGRFNPEQVGALKVTVHEHAPAAGATGAKKGEAAAAVATTATYPLRELAQVVPKGGRTISLLVHEEASVKAILSAVQASPDFNQQPQRDPDNPLELVLKVEAEKREDLVKRVKGLCHDWRERVRQVRQKRDKVHAQWKKDGSLLPDMKRKADTELDKVIKVKIAEIDAAEKEALKAVEAK
jgi:ribosome recycling factor